MGHGGLTAIQMDATAAAAAQSLYDATTDSRLVTMNHTQSFQKPVFVGEKIFVESRTIGDTPFGFVKVVNERYREWLSAMLHGSLIE